MKILMIIAIFNFFISFLSGQSSQINLFGDKFLTIVPDSIFLTKPSIDSLLREKNIHWLEKKISHGNTYVQNYSIMSVDSTLHKFLSIMVKAGRVTYFTSDSIIFNEVNKRNNSYKLFKIKLESNRKFVQSNDTFKLFYADGLINTNLIYRSGPVTCYSNQNTDIKLKFEFSMYKRKKELFIKKANSHTAWHSMANKYFFYNTTHKFQLHEAEKGCYSFIEINNKTNKYAQAYWILGKCLDYFKKNSFPINTEVFLHLDAKKTETKYQNIYLALKADNKREISIDFIAHEASHLIFSSSGMNSEASIISEAIADFFSVLIESEIKRNTIDWQLFEDVYTKPKRSIKDPNKFNGAISIGDSNWVKDSTDIHYRHRNSTVLSHLFYKLIKTKILTSTELSDILKLISKHWVRSNNMKLSDFATLFLKKVKADYQNVKPEIIEKLFRNCGIQVQS